MTDTVLKKRLIARLQVKAPNLVKTVRLEGLRVVTEYRGDPYLHARRYDIQGIDEILFLDIVASLYGRNHLADLLELTTKEVFCPVTVAGGIRSVDDAQALFRAGADKIAVNTAAIDRPELITELAEKFGSQAVVLQLDAKETGDGWEAWCDGGRRPTGRDAVGWARMASERGGCGEIVVTSIDQEGTGSGCDLDLTRRLADTVSVPVVASGGVGTAAHVVEVMEAGADGVAIGHALHEKITMLDSLRYALNEANIPVRMLT